jgi:hypothetical protein
MRRHAGIKNAAPATQPGRHFDFMQQSLPFCVNVLTILQRYRFDVTFPLDV